MKPWKLKFDGSCSKQEGSGAGVILENPDGVKETYHRDLGNGLTCNQSEYAALVTGLEIAKEKKIHHVQIRGDSKLICNQVLGNWEVKFEKLQPFYQAVKELTREFKTVEIIYIPKEENFEADAATKNSTKTKL